MIEKIIEAVFDGWCEGEYGSRKDELPQVQQIIDSLCKQTNADKQEEMQIEKSITELVCLYEKNAFVEGFCLCMDLLQGNLK